MTNLRFLEKLSANLQFSRRYLAFICAASRHKNAQLQLFQKTKFHTNQSPGTAIITICHHRLNKPTDMNFTLKLIFVKIYKSDRNEYFELYFSTVQN